VVEADGKVKTDDDAVQFVLDKATSELVLTFARFISTLVYDPGMHSRPIVCPSPCWTTHQHTTD
jgi:hypothetical protein